MIVNDPESLSESDVKIKFDEVEEYSSLVAGLGEGTRNIIAFLGYMG